MQKIGLVITIGLSVLALGCSHVAKRGGNFKNSVLSLWNPAPEKLSPPKNYDKKVDEFTMQSTADYQFSLGESYSMDGQTKKAIEAFKAALVYDEKSIPIRIRLAEEFVKAGMFTEALEEAEFALTQDENHIPTRLLLGNLYSGLKMYDLAMSQFNVVLDREPDNVQAPLYIGAILAEQKKYDEAVEHFTKLAKRKKSPKRHLYYYYIGRIYSEQGKEYFDKAEESYSESLRAKPDFQRSVVSLARLYIRKGQYKSAVSLLKSFQEKFLSSREVAKILSQIYIEQEKFEMAFNQLKILEGYDPKNLGLKLQMSLMLIRMEKWTPANQRLQELLLQAPDSDKVLYYLGYVNEELKKYDTAIRFYNRIVPESSYYIETSMHTSHLLKTRGELKPAIARMQEALAARPESPELHAYYVTLLDEAKQFKTAVSFLEKAVKKFPGNTQLHFFLGSMYDRLKDVPKTIAQMQKVIDMDDKHVQALNFLAYTFAEMGENLDAAEGLVDRAIALQPDDGYILDTKGWILFKQGRLREAVKYLEKAYSLKADESIIVEHLGDAYYRLELITRARKMYVEAARLEKDVAKVREIQQKITAVDRQIETNKSRRLPASSSRTPAEKSQ